MILDALLMFSGPSSPQSLAQVVGTYPSTNIIDWHMAGLPVLAADQGARDMGIGDDPALKLLVQVGTAFVSAGGGTLQVTLQGATDDGTGSPSAYSSWWASPLYTAAQAVAGARLMNLDFPRPPQGVAIPRFVRLLYGVATATITAGTITAGIVLDRDDQAYQGTSNAVLGGYPPGITVAN